MILAGSPGAGNYAPAMQEGGLPPAGYYPDPDNPAVQRWWDGRQWATPATLPSHLAPPGSAPSPPRTSPLAIASLVLSLAWVAFLGSIAGVVLGHLAIARIAASEGRQGGRGIAMAGLIVGYTGLTILVAMVAALLFA